MTDEEFDTKRYLDESGNDDGLSSARMIGSLALTVILYPVFAVWLFFQGFTILQIFFIVWLVGSFFFVGLLIVSDLVSDWIKRPTRKNMKRYKDLRGISALVQPAAALESLPVANARKRPPRNRYRARLRSP